MANIAPTARVVPCKSCGANIHWLLHEHTGKVAPIDAQPSTYGNLIVDREHRTYRNASQAEREQLTAELYVSHFAVCVSAASHREPKGARG